MTPIHKGLSVHVVDVAGGHVARGMAVEVLRMVGDTPQPLVAGTVGDNGVVSGLADHDARFTVGRYEMRLHVADWYRAHGTALADPPFMDVQVFRFAIADTAQHYHLPVKLTPWGLSCFRGA